MIMGIEEKKATNSAFKRMLRGISKGIACAALLVCLNQTSIDNNSTRHMMNDHRGINNSYTIHSVSAPMGIAAYANGHSSNNNGEKQLNANSISTDEVAGYYELDAFLPEKNNGADELKNKSASIQLNANLMVEDNDGKKNVYWLQDVISYTVDKNGADYKIRDYPEYSLCDFVPYGSWITNFLTQRDKEMGGYENTSLGRFFYLSSKWDKWYPYVTKMPSKNLLDMKEVVLPYNGVVIEYKYYEISRSGKMSLIWERDPMIKDPNVKNANFVVLNEQSSLLFPKSGKDVFLDPGDVELVFGGIGNGLMEHFGKLDAKLSLFYDKDGKGLVTFPYVYTYGSDTGETTNNVNVRLNGNFAEATVGKVDMRYLGAFPQYTLKDLISGNLRNESAKNDSNSITAHNKENLKQKH